jgi:hypothetical protein
MKSATDYWKRPAAGCWDTVDERACVRLDVVATERDELQWAADVQRRSERTAGSPALRWLRRVCASGGIAIGALTLFLLANGTVGDASQVGLPNGVVAALSAACQLPNAHIAHVAMLEGGQWEGRCGYAPFDWPSYRVTASCVDGQWNGHTGYPGSSSDLGVSCQT